MNFHYIQWFPCTSASSIAWCLILLLEKSTWASFCFELCVLLRIVFSGSTWKIHNIFRALFKLLPSSLLAKRKKKTPAWNVGKNSFIKDIKSLKNYQRRSTQVWMGPKVCMCMPIVESTVSNIWEENYINGLVASVNICESEVTEIITINQSNQKSKINQKTKRISRGSKPWTLFTFFFCTLKCHKNKHLKYLFSGFIKYFFFWELPTPS